MMLCCRQKTAEYDTVYPPFSEHDFTQESTETNSW